MARTFFTIAVCLAGGMIWPSAATAADPVGIDFLIDFDELDRPGRITVSWDPVRGAANYAVVWGPKSQPKTYSSLEAGRKTKVFLPVEPGEATVVTVLARDKKGREIARSHTDVVRLPKGKLVGTGLLRTYALFRQLTGTGHDIQDTRGVITIRFYENPSLGEGRYEVYGLGEADFMEKTQAASGTFTMEASAPVYVTGFLRRPTEEERKKSPVCRMDLKIREAFEGRVAHASGSVHGIPVPDSVIRSGVVKKAIAFPLIKGHEADLGPDPADNFYKLTLTDIQIDAKTGCAPK